MCFLMQLGEGGGVQRWEEVLCGEGGGRKLSQSGHVGGAGTGMAGCHPTCINFTCDKKFSVRRSRLQNRRK